MKRILCSACIALISLQAFAGEVEDSLKKFEGAVQKIEEQAKASGKEVPSWDSDLEMIRQNISSSDLKAAMNTLNNISFVNAERRGLKIDEQQKQSLVDLRTALQREQEKREKEELGSTNVAISRATAAVRKAKTAADLDASIEELQKIQIPSSKRERESESVKAVASYAEDVLDYVLNYQEYLSAKAGGYEERAREIAKNLTFAPARLMPRSEMLAKAYEPKGAELPKEQAPGAKQ